jgi:putative addiction module component (TIGR02574 family)
MSPQVDELVAAVLRLTEPERAEVIERLLDALDPPPSDVDRMTEEEFAAELDRRHAEYLRDPTVGIPWEEVRRKRSFE